MKGSDKDKKDVRNKLSGHDAFFKKAMSRKRVAKEFMEAYLPEEVKEKVNLDTLERQNSEFLSNILGKGTSDILYKVSFGESQGYIVTIIEHQSSSDRLMTFRMKKYVLRLCEEHLRKSKKSKFPVVLPLVFYTGKSKYSAPRSFYELFEDKDMAKQFLTEDIKVIDVNEIKDEQLREKHYANIMVYLMKHIYEKEFYPYLKEVMGLLSAIAKNDFQYIEDMVYYILQKAESSQKEDILSSFKEIAPTDKRDGLMTIAEQLIEEGIQIGMQKGIQKGMHEGIQKGIQKGREEEKLQIAKILLKKGLIDKESIEKIIGIDVSKLNKN